MGVVKSNFVSIKILLILFSVNQFVNCQDWADPYFSDASTDGIVFEIDAGKNVKLYVNEGLGPSTLVIVNYNGDAQPAIDDTLDSGKFITDFGPKVIKDSESGNWIITIDKSVDFENIQDANYKPQLKIYDQTKPFYIVVKNLDDTSPELQADEVKCTVTESYTGSTECHYTVRDLDGCATYSSITFSDEAQAKIFEFEFDEQENFDYPKCLDQAPSNLKKEAKLHLNVLSKLDYETIRNYFLEVLVQDKNGGSSTSQIVITVEDIPDVEPIWTSSISTFTVNEKEEKTFQITARDGDTSINAAICYNLTVENENISEEEKNYFDIVETSGLVTIHPIDRDKHQRDTYSLKIFALECETPDSNTDTTVSIVVKDTNNNIPNICIRNLTDAENNDCLSQVEIFLEEGKSSTLNSFISIDISDPDEGTSGTFKVKLEDDASSTFKWYEAFQVIPNQGYQSGTFTVSVADASKLDYEDENWRDIKLNLVAEEEEDDTHIHKIPITVFLINVNDKEPEFLDSDDGALAVTVRENLPIDTNIFTLRAKDDDGEEDKIKFGLVQAKTLKINPDTGTITTNSEKTFDYELQQQMVVQVFVEDSMGDGPHHKVFATLTITIEDEDDVPPQIALDASTIDVSELAEIESSLPVTITATDVDTNSALEFRIDWDRTTGSSQFADVDQSLFRYCYNIKGDYVDDENFVGKLTIAKKLSWNDVDTIKLVLIVEDLNTESNDRTKQASLTINIRDENDHNPVFDSCEAKNLSITENTGNEVRLLNSQMVAHDEDSSENGNNIVQYFIEPDHDDYDDYITIDPASGFLFTGTSKIDFEKYQVLEYTVVAHNEGGPDGGNTSCQISISVADENDNLPTRDSVEAEIVQIPEDVKSGQHITNLAYHDDDITPPFKKIKFEISDKNLLDYFKIIDDGEGNAELVVDLKDGNEFDFDEGDTTFNVQIKIYDNPDREEGGDQNFAEPLPTIKVNLVDVNDNSPIFNDGGSPTNNVKECFFQVTEEKKQGDHLSDDSLILATDKDSGDFGIINYNLKSVTCVEGTNYKCLSSDEAMKLFEVKKNGNGEQAYLGAKKDLLNLFGEYIIELTANDKGDPPRYSESNFYKGCILDVNDHLPTITYPNVERLIIKKGEGGGIIQNDDSEIPSFTAVDEDYGDYAVVTFYLKGIDPDEDIPFQLSHISGSENSAKFGLKNGHTFEDLDKDQYSLTVKACNGEETNDCPSRPLNVYRINSEEAEPYWDTDREIEYAFTEGPMDDPKNHYTVPKASDPNDLDIPGQDPISQDVFYYLLTTGTENYDSYFQINSPSGEITLLDKLDCEYRTNWTLKIQASNAKDFQGIPLNPDPRSILTLQITVTDINDKSPKFVQSTYVTSVSEDSDTFTGIEAKDPDSGDSISYSIVPNSIENHVEGGGQIDLNNVYKVDPRSGALTFNSKIDPTFRGYLTVNISATDLNGHKDACFVKEYIISDSNKVGFSFRNSRDQVFNNQDGVCEVLAVCFKHPCVPGKIIANANATDGMETTLYTHFTDESGDPILSSEIEIARNDPELLLNLTNELISKFNLNLIGVDANGSTANPEENNLARTVLIAVCALLGALLIALLALYIVKTRNLRKLVGNLTKASVPHEDKGNFALPNTNQYNNEGSNPVFNANINTQQFDNASISSSDSSLIGIEDNPEFQAFYNNVILKSEGKEDDDVLKENPQLNAFKNSDTSDINF